MLHSLYTLKYSRGDERQADELGTQLLREAGYDPAGLLMALRKIGRFQDTSGGEPPKIFSNHPPTQERLDYLETDLQKMGVQIPSDDIKTIPNTNKIGSITSLSGTTAQFNSSKTLHPGDLVWLMGQGWDYRYENKIEVPMARGIVSAAGSTYQSNFALVPGAKSEDIKIGSGVYSLPGVNPPQAYAEVQSGKIVSKDKLDKFDRLMAVDQVWDNESNKVINGSVGYVVITDTTGRFMTASRPEYSYAPVGQGSVLVKLNDTDAKRWVGPIISIGKRGQTIEVLPNRQLQEKKTYEVAAPAWNAKDKYENRVIGTAKVSSTTGKIVLKMLTYRPGKSISDIANGFDVYEESRPGVEK